MSPDKLFDYLDGKLPEEERTKLEEQFVSNPQLRHELEVARRIHGQWNDSREVFAALDEASRPSRGAVIGRRIAILFAALVFLNVLFGLYVIAYLENKRHKAQLNQNSRQEVVQALESTAASAMPTPSLDIGEVRVPAPNAQRDTVVNQIIAAAKQSGGSATKNLSDENGTLIFAEVPTAKENEFRKKLTTLGAQPSTPAPAESPGKTSIIQIRVVPPKP
jgi:anti-sigma factor RsiW